MNGSFDEDLPSTYILSSQDSNLIAEKYRSNIKVLEVRNSKVRNSISLVSFGNDYSIFIYKLNLKSNIKLSQLLKTEMKDVDRTTGETYNIFGANNYIKFQYKTGSPDSVSNILLTFAGDSLKTIAKNDSIISYHLICSNLSLRYSETAPIDIFVVGKEGSLGRTTPIPLNILFLERGEVVYLLIMTPTDSKYSIPPSLLYNIITE